MAAREFLLDVGRTLADILRPLEDALASAETFEALLVRHGWQPPIEGNYLARIEAVFDVTRSVRRLEERLDHLGAASEITIEEAGRVLDEMLEIADAVRTIAAGRMPANVPPPFDAPEFWQIFPADLTQELLATYLETAQPALFAPLHLLGIIDVLVVAADPQHGRLAYRKTEFKWDRLGTLVTNPRSLAEDVYQWGGDFNHRAFVARLHRVLSAFGVPAGRFLPLADLVDGYYAADNPARRGLRELRAPLLIRQEAGLGHVELGVALLPIPPKGDRSAAPSGFLIAPYTTGRARQTQPVGGPFVMELRGGLDTAGAAGLEIRPGDVSVRLAAPAADFDASLALVGTPNDPWIALGTPESSHLSVRDATLALTVRGAAANPALELSLTTTAARFVLDFSEGDGFLQKIIGSIRREFEFTGGLAWSSTHGLTLHGGTSLETVVPIRMRIGSIELTQLVIGLSAPQGRLAFALSVSGNIALGPVAASVDRVGLQLFVEPRSREQRAGIFGDVDVRLGFKPPDGAGLALDAGIVVGGGYLFFDPDKAEYAGVLQLEFQETLTITAIGLLTTRLPDGRSGFSLVVLITAQGFTPIQLGFGFTLNGVGGLLGVHRTVVIDVLRAGVKTGTLDAVLFPTDPIRHAPQILSALRAVFPPAEGRYVFGPMAILGWGTPTILTAELAVLLTLPAPIRLIVLGQFRVLLPSAEDVALIRLQMDALGVIDFDRREAAIDATLYDSRLLQYVLSGDMALRARWGATPTLVVAVGGFHPRFTPPPGFPALERIAVSLTTGDTPRLRLDAYLAVTANTVQIGARLDLYVKEGGFSIQGQLGFDALFTLAPFQFVADVSGRVALKRGGRKLGGVRLDLTVTGPRPLQARGHATFEILSVRHRVRLRATFGHDDPAPPRPAVDIAALVAGALAERRNWSAQTPADGPPLVTLRALDPGAAVLAHPASAVTVRQRLVPLDVEVARFGGVAPAGARRVAIARVALAGQTVAATPVREAFAPGQFLDLTDEEKLAAPAFERYTAGATVAGDALATGARSEADFGYETIYVTPPAAAPPAAPTPYVVPDTRLPGLTRWGAAGRSPLRATGARKYRAPARAVAVADAAFAVVDEATLTPAGTAAAPATRLTYLDAVAARRSHAAAAAARPGRLAIVPTTILTTP